MAARCLVGERSTISLQTTALVNEVCVRLLGWDPVRWQNRGHFFGVSARMMRRVLVDIARRRRADRRGGPNAIRVPLDGIDVAGREPAADLLAVDGALELLAAEDPRKAQVVELRFFGGLSVEETAEALGISVRTVHTDWALARAWLYRTLTVDPCPLTAGIASNRSSRKPSSSRRSARADFLDRACGADAAMRDEVGRLLAAAEQSGDFLGAPALEVFARQIVARGMDACSRAIASPPTRSSDGWGRARWARCGAHATSASARDVAIKLLLPHPSNVDGRCARCSSEARAAGTLNHPNVLTVYDVGEHGGAPFLVTECLEGESLRARLGAGPLAGGRGARHRAAGRARARRGARPRHRASRPQAREHLPRARRPREDPRLRPRDAARRGTAAPSAQSVAGAIGPRRHRGLHGAGAGARRGRRSARRHLRARRRALRNAGRASAVQGSTARSKPWTRP